MKQKLIRATELAEFVYCSKAWHLKYLEGAEVSPVARELQAEANAWHIEQGRSLARGDSYRWAAFAALMLAIVLIVFCWLDGRNDRTADGWHRYGPRPPVLLVERPVPARALEYRLARCSIRISSGSHSQHEN
jgi:hypothetical protein